MSKGYTSSPPKSLQGVAGLLCFYITLKRNCEADRPVCVCLASTVLRKIRQTFVPLLLGVLCTVCAKLTRMGLHCFVSLSVCLYDLTLQNHWTDLD
jgi:hypothetical protein